MRKYGPAHLTLLAGFAVLVGWLTSACGPEDGQKTPSSCQTVNGNYECPLRTGNQPPGEGN